MRVTAGELDSLSLLFCECFDDFELRRFIGRVGGEVLLHNLPAAGVSLEQLAWESTLLLGRHGLIGERLWARLRQERPNRSDRIDVVARVFGATPEPGENPETAPARRTSPPGAARMQIGTPVKVLSFFKSWRRPFDSIYELKPQTRFSPGERIVVEVQADSDAFCVVFHLTPDVCQAVRVFPDSDDCSVPQLTGRRALWVANGVATPPPGRKRFQLIWSVSSEALAGVFSIPVDVPFDAADLRLMDVLSGATGGRRASPAVHIHEGEYEVA